MNNSIIPNISNLKTEAKLKDYLLILQRRKNVIIVSFLSVLLSTFFYVKQIENIYESYSTLVVEDKNPVMNRLMGVRGRSLSFYQGILNSRTFLELVLDSIGIDIFKTAFSKFTSNDAFNYIKKNISLRKTSYISFLKLNCRAKTPELAFFMAAISTDIFQKRCLEVESEESRRALVEIDKQLKTIRNKLENAEQKYRTFREKAGNISQGATPELQTLQTAYAEHLAQLGLKEADLQAEKTQLTKLEKLITPPETRSSPEVSKLRSKLKRLEKEKLRLENLGIRLSSTSKINREIKEIERQLLRYQKKSKSKSFEPNVIRQWQELRKTVINKEAELALFKNRLDSYKSAISTYKKDNKNILSKSLELYRLKRSKEIYENIYNILLEKSEEQRIVNASSGSGIKIVDIAQKPDKPIPKNETRYYLLGIILGLALGLAFAFIMEFNDTSIKSNEDIERYLKLSVLGTIPHITFSKKGEIKLKKKLSKKSRKIATSHYPRLLLNFSGDESISAESYRSLRTNLSFVSPDNPIKCLLVTSAGPSEGKSLTIANLALAYAQMGKKTLLIDTDLRRPVMHHIFGQKREPGFSDLFLAESKYDTVIKYSGRDNLFLITAGMFTPNPAELLASYKMTTHINHFRNNFDIVFFDTPPIIAVTDAALLGTKLDGILLVIRSFKTSREIAQHAVNTLSKIGVKCIGTVLNDIDLSHRYSSYGYYKYYYHYQNSKG